MSTTISTTKKFVIKKELLRKKYVETMLNKLYPVTNLDETYLTYDLNIGSKFKTDCMANNDQPNVDLISNIPTILGSISISDNYDDNDNYDENDENDDNDNYDGMHNDDDDDNANIITEDGYELDKDCLEKEYIGNKLYYLDYSKGIIYDTKYKIIGNIDSYGDIVIA